MISSLYVHIPFCDHICYYCDFAKSKYNSVISNKYLDALHKEIDEIEQDSFISIYIGGGSPSSLSCDQLEILLKMLSRFNVEKEYTIEINPENFDLRKAQIIKEYGINRVSIGIQTFDETLLNKIGRKHTNQDVDNTLKCLDEVGIKNRSIDLMYGFNNQQVIDVVGDLKKAVVLPITHISIYALEVYPKTIFGRNNYQKVDDETDYMMYKTIIDFLNEHSFKQYETSNFAFSDYQSVHNQTYWHYDDYMGVGAGACGKIGYCRYENTHNVADYINRKNWQEVTQLSYDDVVFENIMMSLRLLKGINIKKFDLKYHCSILEKYHEVIEKNVNKGLLEIKDSYLKVSEKGIFVLNDILVDFIE